MDHNIDERYNVIDVRGVPNVPCISKYHDLGVFISGQRLTHHPHSRDLVVTHFTGITCAANALIRTLLAGLECTY
jgi:hypothetical protein